MLLGAPFTFKDNAEKFSFAAFNTMIFILLQMFIGSRYWLSVSLITNNRYRPSKNSTRGLGLNHGDIHFPKSTTHSLQSDLSQ